MKEIKILPSLLSADFRNLSQSIASVEGSCAAGLHCDIMDGHFVPNITFGPMIVEAASRVTNLPLFVHLMIEKPERYIEAFAQAGAAEVMVHVEACVHLHRTLQSIRSLGVRVGVSLNPSTPVCTLEHVIGSVDTVLIMTVNPGFGGQSFIEEMLPKISQTRALADRQGADIDIAVDGGIDVVTAPLVVSAGANMLIAGTSVFGRPSPGEACRDLLEAAMTAQSVGRT